MIIKLSPQRRDDTLEVIKNGNTLVVNGEVFDFSPMQEGSTLPREAIDSIWFDAPIEMIDGEIVVTLLFPNPRNYSPEQAFPVDIVGVPDGKVLFPLPLFEPEIAPLPLPVENDVIEMETAENE